MLLKDYRSNQRNSYGCFFTKGYFEQKPPVSFLSDSLLAGQGPDGNTLQLRRLPSSRETLCHFPLHFFTEGFDTTLDTDACSPEETASATIGSCLNYAKYRIFCAIFKSAPVSALAITATLSYWEVLSDSPLPLCPGKWKARKKRHNGECISTAGVERRGVRSP